jgi:starvation-inducible DNA-binding protein
MDELKQLLKISLANSFAFYLKAQFYHWNVVGENFPQYHSFLGDLYEEVYGSVDNIAELIRTINEVAPGSLGRYKELSQVQDADSVPSTVIMFNALYNDNQTVKSSLIKAYEKAEELKQYGISNYLQDRIQAHEKHAWMIRSITAGA